MVLSTEHLHESACDLYADDHRIADDFIEVIEKVVQRAGAQGVDIDWGAAGCGSCFHIDEDEYDGAVYWIAQNDGQEMESIKFDVTSDQMTREELGHLIVEVAEECSVPVSWNGDTSSSVFLGVEGYYTNYPPGTRVRKKHSRAEGTGVVIDPSLVNDDTEWRVYDQSDYDGIGAGGEIVAEFVDRDDAERFVRNSFGDELHISSIRKHGTRDGDNLVMWDGDGEKFSMHRATDLEPIE